MSKSMGFNRVPKLVERNVLTVVAQSQEEDAFAVKAVGLVP